MVLGFPSGSVVKHPPAMRDSWVQSLGQEDPLEKEMAMHSRILAWRIPWTEEPGGLLLTHGVREELDMTERLTLSLATCLAWECLWGSLPTGDRLGKRPWRP